MQRHVLRTRSVSWCWRNRSWSGRRYSLAFTPTYIFILLFCRITQFYIQKNVYLWFFLSFSIRNPYNNKLKPRQTSTLSHSPLLRNRYVFTVAFLFYFLFYWIIYSFLCSFRSNYSTQRRRRYEEFISKNIWRSVDFIQLMLKWSSKFAPVSHTVLALGADSFALCFGIYCFFWHSQ